jgi:hypothetical protein
MLRDIADSKRVNGNVHADMLKRRGPAAPPISLDATIVSELFWPTLQVCGSLVRSEAIATCNAKKTGCNLQCRACNAQHRTIVSERLPVGRRSVLGLGAIRRGVRCNGPQRNGR